MARSFDLFAVYSSAFRINKHPIQQYRSTCEKQAPQRLTTNLRWAKGSYYLDTPSLRCSSELVVVYCKGWAWPGRMDSIAAKAAKVAS